MLGVKWGVDTVLKVLGRWYLRPLLFLLSKHPQVHKGGSLPASKCPCREKYSASTLHTAHVQVTVILTFEFKQISSAPEIKQMLPLADHSPLRSPLWPQQTSHQMIFPRGRKYSNDSSKSCSMSGMRMSHAASLAVTSLCLWEKAPRTADVFVSTCVMKDIWSIKAYSSSVPFYWWAHGRAGQSPQAFSALAGQGVQRTDTNTRSCIHTYTQMQTHYGRLSFINPP